MSGPKFKVGDILIHIEKNSTFLNFIVTEVLVNSYNITYLDDMKKANISQFTAESSRFRKATKLEKALK